MGAHGKINPPRVVFDTNVVVSALLFPNGRLAILRDAWRTGRATPLACKTTVEELLRVLTYPKFRLSAEERQELLGDYLPYSETLALPKRLPPVPECRDPHDSVFLQLALAAKADFLVTGDADLLVLAETFSIPLVAADEGLRRIYPEGV